MKTQNIVIITLLSLVAVFFIFLKGLRARKVGTGIFKLYDNGLAVGEVNLSQFPESGALMKYEVRGNIYVVEGRNNTAAVIYKVTKKGKITDTLYIGDSKAAAQIAQSGTIPFSTNNAPLKTAGCKCGGGCDGCKH